MTEIISDVLGFLDTKRKEITPEYVRNGKPVYTLRKYADLTDLDAEVLIVFTFTHNKTYNIVCVDMS